MKRAISFLLTAFLATGMCACSSSGPKVEASTNAEYGAVLKPMNRKFRSHFVA